MHKDLPFLMEKNGQIETIGWWPAQITTLRCLYLLDVTQLVWLT